MIFVHTKINLVEHWVSKYFFPFVANVDKIYVQKYDAIKGHNHGCWLFCQAMMFSHDLHSLDLHS